MAGVIYKSIIGILDKRFSGNQVKFRSDLLKYTVVSFI